MLSGKSREFFAGRWYQHSMWMQIEFLSKICFCAHLKLCSKKAILENELSEIKVVTSHLVHFLFKWDIFRGWGRQTQGGWAGSHHRITLSNLVLRGDTGGHLHLCCFQLLTTMNIAVMNNNIYIYLFKYKFLFLLGEYPGLRLLNHGMSYFCRSVTKSCATLCDPMDR